MKICYLIFSHKNFEQLYRLISKLDHPECNFFIHVSKNSSLDIDKTSQGLKRFPNVFLVSDRFSLHWGNYNFIAAILSAMKAIIYSGIDYDRLILLSGQDYPIKSNKLIHDFFSRNPDRNYVGYFSLFAPNKWTPQEGWFNDRKRVENYYLNYRSKFIAIPLKRKMPLGFAAYGGSLWWNLNRECVEYVVNFAQNNPKFIRFMKHTYLVDEIFFQTLLLNSSLRSTIINTDLRYIDWEKSNPTPPAILTMEDFDALAASSALFARKFDMDRDSEILDIIDEKLLRI